MRSSTTILFLAARAVLAAVNIDGSQALWASVNDPSPISVPETYIPDQHICPIPCVDYSNVHSWIMYETISRLSRCKEPILLQLPVAQPLVDPSTPVLIRSCNLSGASSVSVPTEMENPKKSKTLYRPALKNDPACIGSSVRTSDAMELFSSSSSSKTNPVDVASLLDSMQPFFNDKDNCDENVLFGYHEKIVVGIYIGNYIGKSTVASAIKALSSNLRTDGASTRSVAQLCSSERLGDQVFGIFTDTTGNLTAAQQTVVRWSRGECTTNGNFQSKGQLKGVDVLEINGFGKLSGNSTLATNNGTTSRLLRRGGHRLERRVCTSIKVNSGEGCSDLVTRCKISAADFTKYNPASNLCSTLAPGDDVCCTAGGLPVIAKPINNSDGTCATHLIADGDNCQALAKKNGLTFDDLENFNQKKTWLWSECKAMQKGYNMCLSNGTSPLPPSQAGTECGPIVPGTIAPTPNANMSLLNPCPLKACCSNWGYCGPFPTHCDIHRPANGGPGAVAPGFLTTCVSNCEMGIKQSSGPPTSFQSVGYYESWNMGRDCLWMKAKNANSDGSHTHIHWGFLEIDTAHWTPVIVDKYNQWNDFKALTGVKRIVSFGGWAYSTEAATYNILRQAIIENRETFAIAIASFIKTEGLDGVDIDWEYPGAPDILVDGKVIGQKGDGVAYLKFLTSLKSRMTEIAGSDKSVSIAAPASYWYLKAFPIDRIAAVIDYIIYMTYDLHGQWDYGNPNSFDSCDSGKCIRSHINLTETRNMLGIITKAGVPNNKIFVGEASYGRSFHMAKDGCWGPMCEFTGSNLISDAKPGRCTKTPGYIAYAEISEIINRGKGATVFHDGDSNTDVMLYNGDYISYMTYTTKDTRRADWAALNFAGTIDWAVDLQSFTLDDMDVPPDIPSSGDACVSGGDVTVNTEDMCSFTCYYGFCPETLCQCYEMGALNPLPAERTSDEIAAWDDFDVDLNRICKFSCKYGYCPDTVCTTVANRNTWELDGEDLLDYSDSAMNFTDIELSNADKCPIMKDKRYRDISTAPCKIYCAPQIAAAEEEKRTTNYGCVGFYPLDKPIPWFTAGPANSMPSDFAAGICMCDNAIMNDIADIVIEALPAIAQIGCYILMSTLKLVVDIGVQFIPVVGEAIDAGLDAAMMAAQVLNYVYPEEADPEAAFSWWLKPCGGTLLVPDEIKKAFGILSQVGDRVSSFVKPKNVPKGSGRKGEDANPTDRSGMPKQPKPRGGIGKKPQPAKKCNIPERQKERRIGAGSNVIRKKSCSLDKTIIEELIVTSVTYAANAKPTAVVAHCSQSWSQACYHYSSAIRINPAWASLTCPPGAATTSHRDGGKATATWEAQHPLHSGWREPKDRGTPSCDRDEYPPAYLLEDTDTAMVMGGLDKTGQLIRFLPMAENRGAGSSWKGKCFKPPVAAMPDKDFIAKANAVPNSKRTVSYSKKGQQQLLIGIEVSQRPVFSFTWFQSTAGTPPDDGMSVNPCWPKLLASKDPGFTLLSFDPWYDAHPQSKPGVTKYIYKNKYVSGQNGD